MSNLTNSVLTPDFADTSKALYNSTAKAIGSTFDLITTYNENKMKTLKVTGKANAEAKVAKALVKSKLTVNALTKEVEETDVKDVTDSIKTAMDSW